MEINGEGYRVCYDEKSRTVRFSGTLRLGGPDEYAPVESLLGKAIANGANELTIDLCELEFLNSSGINVLYKFAVNARKVDGLRLTAVGSSRVPWQGKSLSNLTKLNPKLALNLLA
jgi:hypothetical protein